MKLLVGTIIADSSERARQWYSLQTAALDQTVDYERVAILPTSDCKEFWSRHLTVIEGNSLIRGFHAWALESLNSYFISRIDEFDYFLFLDSDAFPVRKHWPEFLVDIMTGRYGLRNDIAVIYRPEFYETRLHASVLFATKAALPKLKFIWEMRPSRGGGRERDVYIDPYTETWHNTHRLIRSNRINVHPMLCGVYGNIFYHHGSGSRTNRQLLAGVIYKGVPAIHHAANRPMVLRDELMAAPRRFVSRFLWNPRMCSLPASVDVIPGP